MSEHNERFDRIAIVRAYSALVSYLENCDRYSIRVQPDRDRIRRVCAACGVPYRLDWSEARECAVFAGVVSEYVCSGYCDCSCGGCFQGPIMGHAGISLCDDCQQAGCTASDGTECAVERCPDCECVECECHWHDSDESAESVDSEAGES